MWAKTKDRIRVLKESLDLNSGQIETNYFRLNSRPSYLSSPDSAYHSSPDCHKNGNKSSATDSSVPKVIEVIGVNGKKYTLSGNNRALPSMSRDMADTIRDFQNKQKAKRKDPKNETQEYEYNNKRMKVFGPRPQYTKRINNNFGSNHSIDGNHENEYKEQSFEGPINQMRANGSRNITINQKKNFIINIVNDHYLGSKDLQIKDKASEKTPTNGYNPLIVGPKRKVMTYFSSKTESKIISTKPSIRRVIDLSADESTDSDN